MFLSVCVSRLYSSPHRPEEGSDHRELELQAVMSPRCECWVRNQGPLQEEQVS